MSEPFVSTWKHRLLRALHTIRSYPPDLKDPVFARYPAMKYGERHALDHYAALLAPLARSMMAQAPGYEWVLVSPPVRNLPSGANLLCERVHAILRRSVPRQAIALEPLRLTDDSQPFRSDRELDIYGDYARLDYEARRKMQHGEDEIRYDRQALRGRQVIFVNDINVTGSQLRWLRKVLRESAPAAVHALLIVNTTGRVGRRFPHLESEINGSRLSRQDELASFLRDAELRHTGKLVARLLAMGREGLEYILCALDDAGRRRIIRAMFEDGSYAPEYLRQKLAFVR